MNVDLGIKLQAHLDGELTGRDAQQVTALLESDAEARALFNELQQTRTMLKGNEPEFRLPESREFFWSKIEREVLLPPRDEEILRTWAKHLGLKQGSDDWLKFFDYAAVDSGRIPDYILKDEKLVAQLPVFFRTISGQKPSREDSEKLVELVRNAMVAAR